MARITVSIVRNAIIRPHVRRSSTLAIAACLLLAAGPWAPIAFIYASEWLAGDRCLDSGGSFDYHAMRCDYTANHPYVPFEQRHVGLVVLMPYLRVMSTIALLSVIAVLVGRSLANRRRICLPA